MKALELPARISDDGQLLISEEIKKFLPHNQNDWVIRSAPGELVSPERKFHS